MGGTYTLLVEVPRRTTVTFGALGERSLRAGWYAYVGSAVGPGGFARIDRHRRVAAGVNPTRHWHVDYLLGVSDSRIDRVIRSEGIEAECSIARAIDGDPVEGVGATDCSCGSHLIFDGDRTRLAAAVEAAHAAHS